MQIRLVFLTTITVWSFGFVGCGWFLDGLTIGNHGPQREARDVGSEEGSWEWVEPDTGSWVWHDYDVEDLQSVLVECTIEGLWVDGLLMVSSDPTLDVSGACSSSFLDTWGTYSFEACCDDYCCHWDPYEQDVFEQQDLGPGFEVEEGICLNSSHCPEGEGCFKEGQYGVCRNSEEGEPCSSFLYCAAGLYCSTAGICLSQNIDEGAMCTDGDEVCMWPLHCVCGALEGCKCYDGSAGDPCYSETCEFGLYCGEFPLEQGRIAGPGTCLEGAKGDACVADWQCDFPLSCNSSVEPALCMEFLLEGEVCSGEQMDNFTQCHPDLVCNEAYEPWECHPPGQNDAPCLSNTDCLNGLICIDIISVCSNGEPGAPCLSEAHCSAEFPCEEFDGDFKCVQYLEQGDDCSELSPFISCEPELECNDALDPPLCLVLNGEKWPCVPDEGTCLDGLHCIPSTETCFDGSEGDPCLEDDHCLAPLTCIDDICAEVTD
jgi:hypothetical protein